MKKLVTRIISVTILAAMVLSIAVAAAPANSGGEKDRIIRVGLAHNGYASSALDGANLENSVGSGFTFGYYDSDYAFIPLAETDETRLSVIKTENLFYGSYEGYTSYHAELVSAKVAVGCYHLQTADVYETFEEAYAAAAEWQDGFVAYINGEYRVRIGNWLTKENAELAMEDYLFSYVPEEVFETEETQSTLQLEIKGTSAYGVNVVVTGTNRIVYQYDDLGKGTGMGIEPRADESGTKCVTWFKGYRYYGGFRYQRIGGGKLTVVNMVTLEDYTKGVLANEIGSGSHMEALKAQAVAARTYALYNLGKHRSSGFDICATTDCQVYHGLNSTTDRTNQAVDETKGVVVTYNGKPIGTYYYASNGGASESSSVVWGGSQVNYPYLIGKIDPYEPTRADKIANYNWTKTYSGAGLASVLQSAGYSCGTIKSVKVSAYTDVGNPREVTFTDVNGKSFKLTAYAMVRNFGFRSYHYDLLNTKSDSVSINGTTTVSNVSGLYVLDGSGNVSMLTDSAVYILDGSGASVDLEYNTGAAGDTFTFSGSGWGHNVGMSQEGARAMGELGFRYDEILRFYYTGVTVGVMN